MTPVNETEAAAPTAEDSSRLAAASERASEAYNAARDKSRALYSNARDRATDAFEATREGLDSNPVAALVGGLAIGAVLAAVLPHSRRETKLLSKTGKRLNDGIRETVKSAKQSGLGKLDEFGVNTLKDKLSELAGGKKASAQ